VVLDGHMLHPETAIGVSSIPDSLYALVLLNCSACFTFMDNLCDSVRSHVHPSIMSLSVGFISSLVA